MIKTNSKGLATDIVSVSSRMVGDVERVTLELDLIPVTYRKANAKDDDPGTEHLFLLDSVGKPEPGQAREFTSLLYGAAFVRSLDIKPVGASKVDLNKMTKDQLIKELRAALAGNVASATDAALVTNVVPVTEDSDDVEDLDADDVEDLSDGWECPTFRVKGISYSPTLALTGHQVGGLKRQKDLASRAATVARYICEAAGIDEPGDKLLAGLAPRAMMFLSTIGLDK